MILDQVLREIQLQIGDRGSELRVRLVPESLGEVTMQVRLEEGRLTAQIDVTQPSVKTALESGIVQLRVALQQQGIELDRIDIFSSASATPQESGREQSDAMPHRQGARRGPEAGEDGTGRQARFLGYNTIDMTM
jgi:flagellar hook-length control protein FliK